MDAFPALMYGALIIGVIFMGSSLFVVDFNTHYPGTNMDFAISDRSITQINNTMNNLNASTAKATDEAAKYTQSDNPLTAAFGYLLGVFTSVVGLVQIGTTIPMIIGELISTITSNLSIFYPVWFGMFVTIALAIMGLIYLIYILTKVK
jgi:hypothetical protein